MKRDTEKTALAVRVHGKVEHDAAHDAVGDALDLTACFLGDQNVVAADEGHRDWLSEIAHHCRDAQARILESLSACLEG